MRFFTTNLSLGAVFIGFTALASVQSAVAQNFAQEKASIRELPASAAAFAPTLKSGTESGVYASTAKKQTTPEAQKQYLKTHPEGAYILPADTQDRLKTGQPIFVTPVNADNLATSAPVPLSTFQSVKK